MKNCIYLFSLVSLLFFTSCGGIKSTLKNVDNTAVKPSIRDNHFVLTEYSNDPKYGYNADYPINIGFENEKYSLNYCLKILTTGFSQHAQSLLEIGFMLLN